MTAGQAVFTGAADVAALDALADLLSVHEAERGALHVAQLRTLLRLHALYLVAGMEISTVPHTALALGASEHRVQRLLHEACSLGALPGALEALECGLLTVEQSVTLVQQLEPLPFAARLVVWQRLQTRLVVEAEHGTALPPARLAELLRRWAVAADPADATERRRRAEAGRRLDYRRRADGLTDLFAQGLSGPDAQAILSRVRDRAQPVGPEDDRTADQRRLDAFKDLLLGRDPLPLHDAPTAASRAGCGCWPGAAVPCGAEVLVHVSRDAALGVSAEPAEQVGHGPLEPDLLAQLLLASPRLRLVWTDGEGVPVAVSDRVVVPTRGNPQAIREALLGLADEPAPLDRHARHPDDHDHADPTPDARPATTSSTHMGGPGSYRMPPRLRRLIDVRAPRCEWPGCGAAAARCDAEHDVAWPQGPTCACNLGPCCRRHHRVKQNGWSKQRSTGAAVTWTSPGGARRWTSPPQHPTPAPPTHAPPVADVPDPLDELGPTERDEQLWRLADRPDDPAGLELRAASAGDPAEVDVLAALLVTGDTRWSLDLDDPYAWTGEVRTATASGRC